MVGRRVTQEYSHENPIGSILNPSINRGRSRRNPVMTVFPHLRAFLPFCLLAPAALAASEAVQWRVAEFSFVGQEVYVGEPRGVRLEAVFHGPNGASFVVPGFWDGDRNWKIRFAPTAPGDWTYETRAVEEDARVVQIVHSGKVLRGGEAAETVDVALDGVEEIELVVRDGGDGSEYDHADWGEAKLVRKDGSIVFLDTLTPLRATQGHGTLAKNTNLEGKPLRIGDQTFAHGLGSHSPGRVGFRLDGSEARFQARVGVDAQVGRHGSVRFEVLATRRNQQSIGRRDPGLHGKLGQFHVREAADGNLLQRHGGFLKVSGDGHALSYADGTPFFWLGDTWWFCPSDLVPIDGSTNPEIPSAFREMLRVRKDQGFTTIHMAFLDNINGYNPFDEPARGAGLDPAYWRKVDRYVDEANASGLLPVIGLGWSGRPLDPSEWKLLWRHVIARYGAHAVTWLVCGEYNVRGAEDKVADTLALGRFIKETDPYHRAMTVHPWYFEGDKRQAWAEPWYDFIMFQGGHGAPPPTTVYQDAFTRQPAKPVLEGECQYEGIHTFTDRNVREVAWRAICSGAFGYTYGSQGLWYPTQNEADQKTSEWGTPQVWWKALRRPGATQLGHLRTILESVPWWKLAPRPDLVVPAPAAGEESVVVLDNLIDHFAEAKATGDLWHRLGDGEPARLELHPSGGDAVLAFPPIQLPAVGPGESLRLLTAFGFNPAARLDDPENPSNGVRFSIRIDGKEAAQARHHEKSWIYQSIDLTARAGRAVSISFVTNAEGNSNWDHAAFRRPVIVRAPSALAEPLHQDLAGPPPRRVLAKADADRTILLYFSSGDDAARWRLRPLAEGARYRAAWRDPRTATETKLPSILVEKSGLPLPNPPDAEDWVLVLEKQ